MQGAFSGGGRPPAGSKDNVIAARLCILQRPTMNQSVRIADANHSHRVRHSAWLVP